MNFKSTNLSPVNTLFVPSTLLDRLCGRIESIEMVSPSVRKALQLTSQLEYSEDEFAQFIEADHETTDELAKLNSWLTPITRPTDLSVRALASYWGPSRFRNLAFAAAASVKLKKFGVQQSNAIPNLAAHSFTTAVLAHQLTNLLGLTFQGAELAAGMMHDIGWSLLAISFPEKLGELPHNLLHREEVLQREERSLFQTTHDGLGAWFSQQNHLPEEILLAIQHHHQPLKAPAFRCLTAIVALADELAIRFESAEIITAQEFQNLRSIKVLELLGIREAGRFLHSRLNQLLNCSTPFCLSNHQNC
ncbi:HDOD domain-containing protein [Planctomicrobium sp. SH668]|uniref:HDOD domain-containing protein n=1 Tax=Planctomicrobium sp. SH668 TaxID=3448126 RepID=UPI003F5B643C